MYVRTGGSLLKLFYLTEQMQVFLSFFVNPKHVKLEIHNRQLRLNTSMLTIRVSDRTIFQTWLTMVILLNNIMNLSVGHFLFLPTV